MGDTGFIHKKNSCKVVVSKGSINLGSKYADANFHMTLVVYVSAAKYVAPPLLIIPRKRLNEDIIKSYDTDGFNITTPPKGFINSTLFLSCIELFANSVPDSVMHMIVLVYDGYCSHYNDYIKKKSI